jgi:hypothetical protein
MTFEVHSWATAFAVVAWFFCAGFGWAIGLGLGSALVALLRRQPVR